MAMYGGITQTNIKPRHAVEMSEHRSVKPYNEQRVVYACCTTLNRPQYFTIPQEMAMWMME